MPNHNDRLMQRIMEALDAQDAAFKVVRFAAEPGSPLPYTAGPPVMINGSPEQRLEVLEAWHAELAALSDDARKTLVTPEIAMKIDRGVAELVRLRDIVRQEQP